MTTNKAPSPARPRPRQADPVVGSSVLSRTKAQSISERAAAPASPQSLDPPSDVTRPRDAARPLGAAPDEPAWQQAFVSANGVRFTRTPEAIMRRRSLLAGVAKGGMESDPQALTDNVATALLSIVEPEAAAQVAAPDPQSAPLPAGLSRPS